MKVIMHVGIDERLLGRVLAAGQAQGKGFEDFLEAALRTAVGEPVGQVSMPVQESASASASALLMLAVQQAAAISAGTEFHLDDVCEIADWEALAPGERKILGKSFRKAVEGHTPPIAKHVGRTSGNKAIYQRL